MIVIKNFTDEAFNRLGNIVVDGIEKELNREEMNYEATNRWLKGVEFDETEAHYVSELNTYKIEKIKSVLYSVIIGLLFMYIPVSMIINNLKNDYLEWIHLLVFIIPFSLISIKIITGAVSEMRREVVGTISGRFISKYKRRVKVKGKSKHQTRFFIIVDIGGNKVTLRANEGNFKSANANRGVWVAKETYKGYYSFLAIVDKERDISTFNHKESIINNSNLKSFTLDEKYDDVISHYEVNKWYESREVSELDMKVFKRTKEFSLSNKVDIQNFKKVAISLLLATISMYFITFLTYASTSFNLLIPIIALVFTIATVYVFMSGGEDPLLSNKTEVDKAFQGCIIKKYTISIYHSGLLYILRVKVGNDIVDIPVKEEVYNHLSNNIEVWIYKPRSNIGSIKVIPKD